MVVEQSNLSYHTCNEWLGAMEHSKMQHDYFITWTCCCGHCEHDGDMVLNMNIWCVEMLSVPASQPDYQQHAVLMDGLRPKSSEHTEGTCSAGTGLVWCYCCACHIGLVLASHCYCIYACCAFDGGACSLATAAGCMYSIHPCSVANSVRLHGGMIWAVHACCSLYWLPLLVAVGWRSSLLHAVLLR